jgi:predicted membrane metal-binding protein
MFAGDKKSVHPEVQKALRQLGLSHLLAVSGYHVALVSLFFFLLLRL